MSTTPLPAGADQADEFDPDDDIRTVSSQQFGDDITTAARAYDPRPDPAPSSTTRETNPR